MSTDNTSTENILQALEALGGWATVQELAQKSGYTVEWTRPLITRLVDTGRLQKSNLSPYLYSLYGKPLYPILQETFDSAEDIKRLAKAAAHTVGTDSFLKHHLGGNPSNTTTLKSILKLASLAGYDLVLTKKK